MTKYERLYTADEVDGMIARAKAAAAQPAPAQQEPVAEVKLKMTGGNVGIATVIHEIYSHHREPLRPGDKLYTTPPAAPVPLTPEGCQILSAGDWVSFPLERAREAVAEGRQIRFLVVASAAQPAQLTDPEIDELLRPFPRNASEWSMTDFRQFARAARGITKGSES